MLKQESQTVELDSEPNFFCEYDESTQRSVSVGLVLDLFGIVKENSGTTSLARAAWSTGVQTRRANINPVAITFPANETVLEMYEGMIVQFQPAASNKLFVHSLETFGETSSLFYDNCRKRVKSDFSTRRLNPGGKGNRKIP